MASKSILDRQFKEGCEIPLLTWQVPLKSPWFAAVDATGRSLTKTFPPLDRPYMRSFLSVESLQPGTVYYVEMVYSNPRVKFMYHDTVQVGVYLAEALDPFETCFSYSASGWALACSNGQIRHETVDDGAKVCPQLESGDIIGLKVDMKQGALMYVNGSQVGVPWPIAEFRTSDLKVAVALCEYKSSVTLLNRHGSNWRRRRGWLFSRRYSKKPWISQVSSNMSREIVAFL